ncbi:ankyrin repeat-containing domain protein [Jimgerdemannia flammicorona]|uniref:Ankyrin repeat-containing domain protein n=1 Tax=Jimgerdemannia flammicorona TaxID=994334 RepID=A0A433DFQ7_9FUNG|nr:ankyrin repeat-containing domain protein [Jimgerdemannia flammicorona]
MTLSILTACHKASTPVVFSMTRHALGAVICGTRDTSFSCIGITRVDGAEGFHRRMLDAAEQGRQEWIQQFAAKQGRESPADKASDMADDRPQRPQPMPPVLHNSRNETPLWLAAYYGYDLPGLVDRCVATGWRLDEPDGVNGMTPLLVACRYGRVEFAHHILKAYGDGRVDVTAKSFRGETCAFLAAAHGHDDVLALMLEHYREARPYSLRQLVNAPNAAGFTPLMVAARGGHLECVRTLLQYADVIDLWAREPANKSGIMEMAVVSGEVEVVRAVLVAGETRIAEVSARNEDSLGSDALPLPLWNTVNNQGETPLIVACKDPNFPSTTAADLVRALVHASIPPPPPPPPKAYVRRSGKPPAVAARASKPMPPDAAYVNARDRMGHTAVWWAAWGGRREVVKILVWEGKCDIGVPDLEGRVPREVVGMGMEVVGIGEAVNEEGGDVVGVKEETEAGGGGSVEETETSSDEGDENEKEDGGKDKKVLAKVKTRAIEDKIDEKKRQSGRSGKAAPISHEEIVKEIRNMLGAV